MFRAFTQKTVTSPPWRACIPRLTSFNRANDFRPFWPVHHIGIRGLRIMEENTKDAQTAAHMQFDLLGNAYDTFSLSPFRKYLEFPSTFAALGDVTGLAVLDYGCGSGAYTRLLKQQGARRTVGLDRTPGMIKHALSIEESTALGTEYVLQDGPLPHDLESAFDVVLAVYVLPYMTNVDHLEEFFYTAAKALRPGGRLVALVTNPDTRREKKYYEQYGFRMYGDTPAGEVEPKTVNLDICYGSLEKIGIKAGIWSKDSLHGALAKAGFADIVWCSHVVTSGNPMGAEFWQPYLSAPHALIFKCTLST